jgi:C1A family cysteine protease
MDTDQITRPFNQGLCGSCWAVAAATCLSDVFVVSKKVPSNPQLSPTYMLSCLPQSQCDGGDPALASNDLVNKGISTSSCLDYSWCKNTGCSGDPTKHFDSGNINQYIPPCQCKSAPQSTYFAESSTAICIPPQLSEFDDSEMEIVQYYLKNLYDETNSMNLSKESVDTIQQIIKYKIYTYGPVIGGFHVFKNFFKGNYYETNNIYIETCTYSGIPGIDIDDPEKDWAGSHAVVIVGWGVDTVHDEEVKYWVVRNSWGTNWGAKGYFYMPFNVVTNTSMSSDYWIIKSVNNP